MNLDFKARLGAGMKALNAHAFELTVDGFDRAAKLIKFRWWLKVSDEP